jgi:hypothetical protein
MPEIPAIQKQQPQAIGETLVLSFSLRCGVKTSAGASLPLPWPAPVVDS